MLVCMLINSIVTIALQCTVFELGHIQCQHWLIPFPYVWAGMVKARPRQWCSAQWHQQSSCWCHCAPVCWPGLDWVTVWRLGQSASTSTAAHLPVQTYWDCLFDLITGHTHRSVVQMGHSGLCSLSHLHLLSHYTVGPHHLCYRLSFFCLAVFTALSLQSLPHKGSCAAVHLPVCLSVCHAGCMWLGCRLTDLHAAVSLHFMLLILFWCCCFSWPVTYSINLISWSCLSSK